MGSRVERERSFFDDAPEQRRRRLDKYYVIAARSSALYRDLIAGSGRVLELGCGDGTSARELAQSGADVVAIDISERRIASARTREDSPLSGGLSFFVMNAENLEFADNSFDLICGQAILHHLDLRRSLSEVARTLEADGRAVFIEPLGRNPFIRLYRRLTPRLRTPDEAPLSASDLELASEFFAMANYRFFHMTSLISAPILRFPGGGRVLSALERFDQMLFRAFPRLRIFAWRVVIELHSPRKNSHRR